MTVFFFPLCSFNRDPKMSHTVSVYYIKHFKKSNPLIKAIECPPTISAPLNGECIVKARSYSHLHCLYSACVP